MLKMMTAEITPPMGSLVVLTGAVGSDRRIKQTGLIFHQLHCFITLSVCGPSVVNERFRRMWLLALAFGR